MAAFVWPIAVLFDVERLNWRKNLRSFCCSQMKQLPNESGLDHAVAEAEVNGKYFENICSHWRMTVVNAVLFSQRVCHLVKHRWRHQAESREDAE